MAATLEQERPPAARTSPPGAQQRFAAARKQLTTAFIERDTEIDLMLTGLICGEHVLLVGPPGTAKSALCNAVAGSLSGSTNFHVLLTKFSTPEELFGPLSIVALEQGRYERVTDGMLPEAQVAFVDEVWKASSAILNTMLTLMNERRFFNNGQWRHCPLKMMVAGSNEWPIGEGYAELGAAFDRFLFRKAVKPIAGAAGRNRLLWATDAELAAPSGILALSDVGQAAAEAADMVWDGDARVKYEEILRLLSAEGIVPGDRRLRKAVKAAAAYAWLGGAQAVESEHLEVLSHILWDDPAEQAQKCAQVVMKAANPDAHALNELLAEAHEIIERVAAFSSVPKETKAMQEYLLSINKIEEVKNRLKSLKQIPRVVDARTWLTGECKRLRARMIGGEIE